MSRRAPASASPADGDDGEFTLAPGSRGSGRRRPAAAADTEATPSARSQPFLYTRDARASSAAAASLVEAVAKATHAAAQRVALGQLRALVKDDARVVEAVIDAGGLEAVCSALAARPGEVSLQLHGCAVLSRLCHERCSRPALRQRAARCGAAEVALAALVAFGPAHAAVATSAAAALASLALEPAAAARIVASGGVAALGAALRSHPVDGQGPRTEKVQGNGLAAAARLLDACPETAGPAAEAEGLDELAVSAVAAHAGVAFSLRGALDCLVAYLRCPLRLRLSPGMDRAAAARVLEAAAGAGTDGGVSDRAVAAAAAAALDMLRAARDTQPEGGAALEALAGVGAAEGGGWPSAGWAAAPAEAADADAEPWPCLPAAVAQAAPPPVPAAHGGGGGGALGGGLVPRPSAWLAAAELQPQPPAPAPALAPLPLPLPPPFASAAAAAAVAALPPPLGPSAAADEPPPPPPPPGFGGGFGAPLSPPHHPDTPPPSTSPPPSPPPPALSAAQQANAMLRTVSACGGEGGGAWWQRRGRRVFPSLSYSALFLNWPLLPNLTHEPLLLCTQSPRSAGTRPPCRPTATRCASAWSRPRCSWAARGPLSPTQPTRWTPCAPSSTPPSPPPRPPPRRPRCRRVGTAARRGMLF